MVRCNECEHGQFKTVRTACMLCNRGDCFTRAMAKGRKRRVRKPIADGRGCEKNNICHPLKFQKPFHNCDVV